jgi:hypothetical protein
VRTKTIAAALAVAALAAVSFLAVQADGESTATTEITLAAKPTGGTQVDLDRKGPSPGDEFLEHGALSDVSGHPAGPFQLTSQLVYGSARSGREQSTIVLYLSGGELVATGGHKTSDHYRLPIVGGTGSYGSASGSLTVSPGRHGTEQLELQIGD